MPRESLLRTNIKENHIGRILEAERLHWRLDGEPRHYHSLTRGWLANEVFRRLHPDGITIGEFLSQEISSRLGADIYLGLEEAEQSRVFDVEMTSWVRPLLLTNWLPRNLGRRDDLGVGDLARCVGRELWNSRTGHRPAPPIQGMGLADPLIFNCAEVRAGEVPSAGVHASARGLARLGSLMSRGGREGDLELLSPSAWAELHSQPTHRHMVFHHNTFTKGGLAYFTHHQADQKIDRVGSRICQ